MSSVLYLALVVRHVVMFEARPLLKDYIEGWYMHDMRGAPPRIAFSAVLFGDRRQRFHNNGTRETRKMEVSDVPI